MFVLVTDYTLRNIMSANDQGIVAVTGRAHCQRQVAFLYYFSSFKHIKSTSFKLYLLVQFIRFEVNYLGDSYVKVTIYTYLNSYLSSCFSIFFK